MLILKIFKGVPTAQDWAEIGKMIDEGFKTGIDRPPGINWDLEWQPSSNAKIRATVQCRILRRKLKGS